ncbi:RYamide receptor-like [Eriocheir sinensis]|uniref:RYamide receptor-like n=1 Tax=Eriocheir sinensis TaxID=95602 RepID=UPI0021C79AAC|nr:RYamide receptor-like [Eriocheir sinensis]XP_050720764.1 RYamide receptor-like [Eriocheir sinensis]XP_050720766.1 RYamide receptor-like [Eriocheir sinensis]
MSAASYRLSKFLSASEDLRNESESILTQCNASLSSPETLDAACDTCNASGILMLWEEGLCDHPPTPGFDSAVYILYITVLVIAVLGNSVVVYVVCSSEKMRTVTNYFIANLAIGDLFMAILCVPFSFISTLILKYWPFGGTLCVAVNYLQAVSVFVSAYTLVAISLDRYLAIIYPLRPRMTRCQAKVIIAAVWILSLATTLPVAVYSRLLTPPINFYSLMDREVCTEDWGSEPSDNESRVAYSVALMLLQYFLPLTVLVFTYSRIAMVVWGKRTLGETPARVDRIARSKRKTVKMMAACVVAYTLAWLPLNLYIVLADVPGLLDLLPDTTHVLLFFTVHCLAMSHTCYNPIIYFWMNGQFRAAYCRALPCLRGLHSRMGTSEGLSTSRLGTSKMGDGQVVLDGCDLPASSYYDTPAINLQILAGEDGRRARYLHLPYTRDATTTTTTTTTTHHHHLQKPPSLAVSL